MEKQNKTIFFLILVLALLLRLYGINWDKGAHLHPDERMIIMVSERINLPPSISEFLQPQSSLNPHFFAYGSFPIYLLKATGFIFRLDNYDGLLYAGRSISVFFDLVTVILVYKITSLIFPPRGSPFRHLGGVLAAFLYATSVLPIQASHFYAVDIALTAFSTLTLFALLLFLKNPSIKTSLLIGLSLGLSLGTKVTIGLLVAPVIFVLFLLSLRKKSPIFVSQGLIILGMTFLIFNLIMPYALIDFAEFKKQVLLQLEMNKNPYIFPYTLQYVGTTPYLYYLKNIILWGLGVPYGLVAISSVLLMTFLTVKTLLAKKISSNHNQALMVLLIFFWIYFLIVGKTAVKFMRYLLPLYPLLAIFSAYTMFQLLKRVRSQLRIKHYESRIKESNLGNNLKNIRFKLLPLLPASCFLLLLLVWPFSFLHIYQQTHTRMAATYWINQNIPPHSRLGIEHWDDRLPLFGGENYLFNELTLYDFDNLAKWETLSQKLSETDYLIIASNRLYIPLPKLTDCQVHRNYCYPYTARYYKELFSGNLGFNLVASFSSYPTIPLLNIEINDDGADESFTVYDHPKIYIFKNEARLSQEQLFKFISGR